MDSKPKTDFPATVRLTHDMGHTLTCNVHLARSRSALNAFGISTTDEPAAEGDQCLLCVTRSKILAEQASTKPTLSEAPNE